MRAWAMIACAACASAPRPAPVPVARLQAVRITGARCLDARDVESRITAVFAAHHAERSLSCDVVERAGEPAQVSLRVVRPNGELGLERSYTFGAMDCGSAPQLLALTVDRWLTSFPEWAEPEPPPAAPARWTGVAATAAVNGMVRPLGVEAAAGVLVDRGGKAHRFGGTLLVRAGLPQTFGSGRFQQTALQAGASWRGQLATWHFRAELRGGALLVSGIGLVDSASDWLPWWEIAAFAGRDAGIAVIGIEVAATGLRARAVTRDGLVSEDIPLLRIGFGATFDIR